MQTAGSHATTGAPTPLPLRQAAGVALATALAFGAGCGKGAAAENAAQPAGPQTNLVEHPDILFQVFGERDDPRMIPLAVLKDGRIEQIQLDGDGWERFDALYTRSPKTVALYQDGRRIGDVTVRQGMWEKAGEPLYSLPSCRLLTPLSAVRLGDDVKAGFTVEFLASTATVKGARPGAAMPVDVATRAAREVAYGVGERAELTASELESLDFRAVAIHTGATAEPTLVASFIDPGASGGEGAARHVFAIADRAGDRYAATFTHAVNGGSNATYRRYVDHLDLTGDGVDEIVLEGWQSGGDTYLLILGHRDGKWTEVFRGRGSWCIEQGT